MTEISPPEPNPTPDDNQPMNTPQQPEQDMSLESQSQTEQSTQASLTTRQPLPEQPAQVIQNINKRWGCAQTCGITFLGLIVMIGLCAVSVAFIGQATLTNFVGSFGGFLQSGPSTAEIISGRTLVNSIQPLGQLVTISTELAQADIRVEVEQGVINSCGHSAHHVAEGVIEAGVDFTLITPDNISYTEVGNAYTITVPYPRITSCRIEYIRQYQASSNFGCSPNWDEVRVLAQHIAMEKFVEDALARGILDRAERENTILMQSFVTALTDAEVTIQYVNQDEADEFIPTSCQPELPPGWRFDSSLSKWINE